MNSGRQYTSRLCVPALGVSHCKLIELYAADSIYADDYLYNVNAGNGILGMGPNSQFWNGLIDPDTYIATYSIQLAPMSSSPTMTGGAIGVSNISLGTANDQAYQGSPFVNATANFDFSYNLSYFGFGLVQNNA